MQSNLSRIEHESDVSPILYYLASLFILTGLVVGFLSGDLDDPMSLIVNTVQIVFMIVCILLKLAKKMSANLSLGLIIYASAFNFMAEITQAILDQRPDLTNDILFGTMSILVLVGAAGFIINRFASLVMGFLLATLLLFALIRPHEESYGNFSPLMIVVTIGFSLVVFYHRGSLEKLLTNIKEAYTNLKVQRNEMKILKENAEFALRDLRVAQKKIISQEKLASLGALTAGIAHEIKNPLNFITNFAESSLELMEELKVHFEKVKGDMAEEDREDVDYLLGELSQNMKDISTHGKRGDHIVKSMLMHSRSGPSNFTFENINALAEECLTLAFHGYRAQESEFVSEREFVGASELQHVEILRGDISRVIINLCTNAFYAVNAKRKQNIANYRPKVVLQILELEDQLSIKIVDNGIGMSAEVKEKLFVPFFTTKPTGEGTGLGLSMSHEIITQEHGGSLDLETVEGSGTTFTIGIPKKQTAKDKLDENTRG